MTCHLLLSVIDFSLELRESSTESQEASPYPLSDLDVNEGPSSSHSIVPNIGKYCNSFKDNTKVEGTCCDNNYCLILF